MHRDNLPELSSLAIPLNNVVMTVLLRKMVLRPTVEDVSKNMLLAALLVEQQGYESDISYYLQHAGHFISGTKYLEQCIDSIRINIRPDPHVIGIPAGVHHWLYNMAHRIINLETSKQS